MKNYRRYMKFQGVKIIIDEQCPKNVSRVYLNIIDKTNEKNNFKSLYYGSINQRTISWSQNIQLPYQAQPYLNFETSCQHEYGYHLQQLKGLYNGKIIINASQFFIEQNIPCFSRQIQCGKLRFMIKIIQREIQNTKKAEKQINSPVKIHLKARIHINSAKFIVLKKFRQIFHTKKLRNLSLSILYNNFQFQRLMEQNCKQYRWDIDQRLDIYRQDKKTLILKIKQKGVQFFQGNITIDDIQRSRRFTLHQVPLYTIMTNEKIGTLELNLSYSTKTEILDLIYSPTKLSAKKYTEQLYRNSSSIVDSPVLQASRQKRDRYKFSQFSERGRAATRMLNFQGAQFKIRSIFLSELKPEQRRHLQKLGRSLQKYSRQKTKYSLLTNYKKSHQLPRI